VKHEVSYCIKPSLVVNILAYPNLLGKKGYVVVVVVVNILKISTKLLLKCYRMAIHKFSDIYCKHLAAIAGMKGINEYF